VRWTERATDRALHHILKVFLIDPRGRCGKSTHSLQSARSHAERHQTSISSGAPAPLTARTALALRVNFSNRRLLGGLPPGVRAVARGRCPRN